jgi:hypothetical protein
VEAPPLSDTEDAILGQSLYQDQRSCGTCCRCTDDTIDWTNYQPDSRSIQYCASIPIPFGLAMGCNLVFGACVCVWGHGEHCGRCGRVFSPCLSPPHLSTMPKHIQPHKPNYHYDGPQGNREGGTVAKGLTRLILARRVLWKNFEQRPKPNFNDTSRRHRRSSRMSRNRWSRRNECTPKQNWKL